MEYRFAEKSNHEDLAAGRVIRGTPGAPQFPVRLASELFQRALAERSGTDRVHLYDPCCGTAYLLTTLGFLHRERISSLTGSDIDPLVVETAGVNLALLSPSGINQRAEELARMLQKFGKESHALALESARRWAATPGRTPERRTFVADATQRSDVARGLGDLRPNLVITDLPYGRLTHWADDGGSGQVLGNLHEFLAEDAIVAVSFLRRDPVEYPGFTRLQRLKLGKREAYLLRRD